MAARVFSSLSLLRSNNFRNILFFNSPFLIRIFPKFDYLFRKSSFFHSLTKVTIWEPSFRPFIGEQLSFAGHLCFHSGKFLKESEKDARPAEQTESSGVTEASGTKLKRKKLKGKRAVVRWLKHFRWKKKKEYERMTAEEKILYKLNKARKKEDRLVQALNKIQPKETSETTHDPEILTPEEHFYFLKMGLKCKNYVPVGRRGIYQGVILNMHLHWKKHQTLKVIVKTFSLEEVKDIAAELARLTGGIVLDIHDEDTIIMYRGKNYAQPPTEIMSPHVTLPRKKALDKSKYRDALRAVRRYIPRLEQELDLLKARAKNNDENTSDCAENKSIVDAQTVFSNGFSRSHPGDLGELRERMAQTGDVSEEESLSDMIIESDSENLSNIFESESESEGKSERFLYLDQFEKFPVENRELGNFEEHLCELSLDSKRGTLTGKDAEMADLDEVDEIFLRAAELLKKKRR